MVSVANWLAVVTEPQWVGLVVQTEESGCHYKGCNRAVEASVPAKVQCTVIFIA